MDLLLVGLISSSFLYGLTSSFHCMSMCGPFVATMNMHSKNKWQTNLVYNLGRLVSYSIIGFLLGYISFGIHFTGDIMQIQVAAAFVSGAFVVFLGLALLFTNSSSTGIFNRIVQKILSPFLRRLSGGAGSITVFLFGLFTGLLPCGVLYPAFAIAFASGSPWSGAMLMGIFFLGTFPGLLIFGIGFHKFKSRISPRIISWAGIIFIAVGLYTIYARLHHDHSGHSMPAGQEDPHKHMHHH